MKDAKHIKAALDKLKAMPDLGSNKRVRVPFPEEDRPFSLSKGSLRGAVHTKVPLDELIATQPSVKRKLVAKYVSQDGKYNPIPTIIKVHGTPYICNGHHRCTADKLLDKKEVRCNLIDLGDGE